MTQDLKKTLKTLYTAPKGTFIEIDVPERKALMIDGAGDPMTAPAYRAALGALYPLAYAIKFAEKAAGRDFVVPPLEGLWHAEDPTAFVRGARDEWRWTMLIPMPDSVTGTALDAARERAAAKDPALPFGAVRLDTLAEGRSLQALHLGSYADEAPLLAHLHDVEMPARGLTFNGPHHEIYLSDPRKVAPEKLRTLLRQPVREV